MMSYLNGRIAKVLSQSAVAINLGSKDAVNVGDEFVIYELGDMIKDPNTKEDLEKLEILKARVIVTHVQEKMSIAESYKLQTRTEGLASLIYPAAPREVTERVQVKIADTAANLLQPSSVKEGDLVRRTRQAQR